MSTLKSLNNMSHPEILIVTKKRPLTGPGVVRAQCRSSRLCLASIKVVSDLFLGRRCRPSVSGVSGFDDVVPSVSSEGAIGLKLRHFFMGYFHAGGAFCGIEFDVGYVSCCGGGRGDGIDDDFMAGQRPATTVHGDMGEELVLVPIPWAGARGRVADGIRSPHSSSHMSLILN